MLPICGIETDAMDFDENVARSDGRDGDVGGDVGGRCALEFDCFHCRH